MQETKWITSFANRLNIALDKRNISPAELAKKLHISEATISNYRKGKYEPKQKRLDQISQILNVSIPWLMGADVPFETRINNTAIIALHPLLQIYDSLNEEGQKNLMDYAEYIANKPEYKKCNTFSEQEIG